MVILGSKLGQSGGVGYVVILARADSGVQTRAIMHEILRKADHKKGAKRRPKWLAGNPAEIPKLKERWLKEDEPNMGAMWVHRARAVESGVPSQLVRCLEPKSLKDDQRLPEPVKGTWRTTSSRGCHVCHPASQVVLSTNITTSDT
jgi:hypothetical protein